ncbi:MAG: ribonuclease HII [Rhodospirillaceae bacterium]|jgi:ribonuclease HII
MPDFALERAAWKDGFATVCGIDEAGRGPWAGPVVAAAVILPPKGLPRALAEGLDDSKKLKPAVRANLLAALRDVARIGVGSATVEEIDASNILAATLLAMRRAVDALGRPSPDLALVDGNRPPELACRVRTVVKGDGLSLSIAAASVVAKQTRDATMAELDRLYPGYGWTANAGYGTAQHQAALARLGPCPVHRRSFAPIRKMLSPPC